MSALDFNVQPLETIADLKGRVDIADFVGRYVKLKRSGANYGGLCPFHAERTPSFQVSPRWQNFKCWGCGVAGDVIDFVGALESLTPGEAIGRFRELVGGAALDPAAVAAQAARRAALAAQEAQDAARNTALARRIWSESEYLTRRSDPLPVAYLTERRGIARWDTYSLRWHPACPWGAERVGCIVAPVENVAGDLVAIWRIRPVMDGRVERRGLGPVKGCTAYPVGSACARCGVGMPPGASRSCAGRSSRAAWRSFRPGSRPTRRVGTTSWPAAGRTGFVARRAATPAATFWRPAICCSAGRAGARPR